MLKTLEDVIKFQNKFFPDEFDHKPNLKKANKEILKMRLNFLLEELTETVESAGFKIKNGIIVDGDESKISESEFIDGLLDLVYVAMGNVHLFGFSKKVNNKLLAEEAWDRIQTANMSKVRAERKTKRGTTFDCIKPPEWKAPYFLDLIEAAQND